MRSVLGFVLLGAALAAAAADDRVAAIGKRLAGEFPVPWELREVSHPVMGPIRVAVPRYAFATRFGDNKIVSLAFVSCEKARKTIAIELANALESDQRGGLGPFDMPRLVCNAPRPAGDLLAKSEIAASWEIDNVGDALARGLSPAALRRCASIDVLQNVALPPGGARESQRVTIAITPYGRELDSVFEACGVASAYAAEPAVAEASAPIVAPLIAPPPPAPPALVVSQPPVSAPPPAPRPIAAATAPKPTVAAVAPKPTVAATVPKPAATPVADDGWRLARTVPNGRTNLRTGPGLNAPVAAQLPPAVYLLVQRAQDDWWHVKPRKGDSFHGYVRADRLIFE